jgi:hypothetical protein
MLHNQPASLFELQEPDSTLPVKPTLLVKLDLESETNSHFELAMPVKLNLDSGHF